MEGTCIYKGQAPQPPRPPHMRKVSGAAVLVAVGCWLAVVAVVAAVAVVAVVTVVAIVLWLLLFLWLLLLLLLLLLLVVLLAKFCFWRWGYKMVRVSAQNLPDGVGIGVVLVAVELHIPSPGDASGISRRLINKHTHQLLSQLENQIYEKTTTNFPNTMKKNIGFQKAPGRHNPHPFFLEPETPALNFLARGPSTRFERNPW